VVFSDKSLREIARIKPADTNTFRMIYGVGDRKLEKYGQVFITAIDEYRESHANEFLWQEEPAVIDTEGVLEKIFELDRELQDLNQRMKEIAIDKKLLLDKAVREEITSQGKFTLTRDIIKVRQLNIEDFKKIHPDVFMEIGMVRLADADNILGKPEVSKFCTLKESVRYQVVDIENTLK
jgi:ATP-dependent DNA helicase RecQ